MSTIPEMRAVKPTVAVIARFAQPNAASIALFKLVLAIVIYCIFTGAVAHL